MQKCKNCYEYIIDGGCACPDAPSSYPEPQPDQTLVAAPDGGHEFVRPAAGIVEHLGPCGICGSDDYVGVDHMDCALKRSRERGARQPDPENGGCRLAPRPGRAFDDLLLIFLLGAGVGVVATLLVSR